MEYWWKENRGLVVPAAAGVVVVCAWYFAVVGGIEEKTALLRRQRVAAEQKLQAQMKAGVPSEDTLSRARRDLEREKERMEELTREMGLKVPASHQVQARNTAGETFMKTKEDETRKKIRDAAARSGVSLPSNALGFSENLFEGVDDALGKELLARLAIVEKVSLGAVEAGVSRIDAVNAEGSETTEKAEFLARLSVRLKVTGTSEAVFKWLHAVQKRGDFLAVDEFKATKESPHEDVFSAEMDVSGLVLQDIKE
ncbi:MAG: hypothetical protein HYY16_06580 [Planctomycetes bacterium]|nr:hypothetical protein [Planctomycetota bacterium]